MEAFSLIGVISTAAKLVKLGYDAVKKTFPEYHRFWKAFSKQLKNDQNVPWDEIESHCYLQPEFIGIAVGLVHGDPESKKRLESYFDFLEPGPEAYEDAPTVRKKVIEAARSAANEATSDRKAAYASSRLLEGKIDESAEEIVASLGAAVREEVQKLNERFAEFEKKVQAAPPGSIDADDLKDQLREVLAEHGEDAAQGIMDRIEALIRKAEGASASPSLDEERIAEKVFERFEGRYGPSSTPRPASGPEAEDVEVFAAEDLPVEDLLKELAKEDLEAATALRTVLLEGGTFAVVKLIRDEQSPDSLAALVTEAQIVGREGFFAEAEAAYLRARDKTSDSNDQARQLVRAATMARSQESDERFRRHLEEARSLAPDHPSLAAAEARASDDPKFMLERLDGVVPETDRDRALIDVTRAQAHLALGAEEKAQTELASALEAERENPAVREFQAILPWLGAKRQLTKVEPDPGVLNEAGERFLGLAEEIAKEQRLDEAAHLTARASESFAMAGDLDRARQILEGIKQPERVSLEARLALCEASIMAQRAELVLRFIREEEPQPEARLIWSEAKLLGESDPEERQRAVGYLEGLIRSADEEQRDRAAFGLISGSAGNADVEWNETAAELVKARKPEAEATMRAERLRIEGDLEGAEKALVAHGSSPQALRQLRDYAAQRGDWGRVRDISRGLVRTTGSEQDRLAYADGLRRTGNLEGASREFLAVARSSTNVALRSGGYGAAVDIAGEQRDYQTVLDLAEEWREAIPDSEGAFWNSVFALARLARHQEAYELVESEEPMVQTPEQAGLLAEVLRRAAPKDEAVQRIAELSDVFDRKEEALEGLLIFASVEAESEGIELPDELAERVRLTFAEFGDRFPASKAIQVISVPSTPEGIKDLMTDLAGDRTTVQVEVVEHIVNGRLPVNAFAAVAPNGYIGSAWARLGFLPLGFATEQNDEFDRDAARATIGRAAVWDSSSLFVVGGLGDLAQLIHGVLPGSLLANETLEDADAASDAAASPSSGEMVHDPQTADWLGMREITPPESERTKLIADGILDLAREFDVAPGPTDETPSELESYYEQFEDRAWKALFASVALAKRLGLPLFSDDRWVRELARHFEVPAFGTAALLDVLKEEDAMEGPQRERARQQLAGSGGWGLRLSLDELTGAAQDVDWDLSRELAGGLRDRPCWRSGSAQHMRVVIQFLQAVFEASPEHFRIWVRRTVDAFIWAVPEMPRSAASEVLLAIAFDVTSENDLMTDSGFKAFVREIKALPVYLTDPGADPVLQTMARLLGYFEGEDVRAAVFKRQIQRLPWPDAQRAVEVFVR